MAPAVEGLIARDPAAAAAERFDLVVVGGGIHGVMMLLEAARRGARALLLEREDFGGATSWNSLRIIHGGLRYLQSADLPRFFESVRERRWLLHHFSPWVRPLPCLLPLYGTGLHRAPVLAAALAVNDLLAARHDAALPAPTRLPRSRVLGRQETLARFPLACPHRLEGAALWHDGVMLSPQRVLIEALRWACALGGRALNYTEAHRLETVRGTVAAVHAVDRLTGQPLRIETRAVVNCAGPWAGQVAAAFDRELPALFHPSLAFNVLLAREPPAGPAAVAVAPRRRGARFYFLVPCGHRTMAGTFHAAWRPAEGPPETAAEAHLDALLEDLNTAIPGWELTRADVLRTLAGLLPAVAEGTTRLATRPRIYAHEHHGGPLGLVSVVGIKFTTARSVAERVRHLLARRGILPDRPADPAPPPAPQPVPTPASFLSMLDAQPDEAGDWLASLIAGEAITSLDDLLLRRLDWGLDPTGAAPLRAAAQRLLQGRLPVAAPRR